MGADFGSEMLLKRLVGRKDDVKDALSLLDMLMKEAGLMLAMTLVSSRKVKHHVCGVVHEGDDIRATKVLTEDIRGNMKANEGVQNCRLQVDVNVKLEATKVQIISKLQVS